VVTRVALIAGAVLAVALVVRLLMPLVWRAHGRFRVWRAAPPPVDVSSHRIWQDPGPVTALHAIYGPGGVGSGPQPPYRFLEEHTTGSQPAVSVRDGQGRVWRVKWGQEVHCETFAVRVASACGYFAEETHFVGTGTLVGATTLTRARACIDDHNGAFHDARFELDDRAGKKMFDEHGWAWNDNPFVGTRELSGLKIVVMLLSNWDTKDRRDVARGSNAAIFEHILPDRRREARYLLTDWGGSMGRWGSNPVTRGRWDAAGFAEQTPGFVTGVADGCVTFGYTGQRTADVADGISLDDVRWFNRYLALLTDDYLTRALAISGASAEDTPRFVAALRDRIDQLATVAHDEAGPLAEDRIA